MENIEIERRLGRAMKCSEIKPKLLSLCGALWHILRAKMENLVG